MKSKSKNKFKKYSQIFNLKEILNNSNNESYILISKISELQKIFKNTKKIINEKINELSKMQKNQSNMNEEQIKQEICIKLNQIITQYTEGKSILSINNKKENIKNLISEKSNELKLMLKKLKYKKLQKEKDLLKQVIKEKRNICDTIKKQIEYEKNLNCIFQPKNLIFMDNLYNVNINNEYLKIKKKSKKKKIKDLYNHTRRYLNHIGNESVDLLKKEKIDYIQKFNNYINDKGFNCSFENIRHHEKYKVQIELINDYDYSSDSEYDIDEESNNNIPFINKNSYNINDYVDNNIKLNNINKNKKISSSSSEKETNDQEKENKKDNFILEKKLVEVKEKYNKLINERYDLDYQKNLLEKKIDNAKFRRNIFSSTSLPKGSQNFNNYKNYQKNKKIKSSFFNKF